jgi:hypothetical protein
MREGVCKKEYQRYTRQEKRVQESDRPFIRGRIYYSTPLVLRPLILASIRLLAKPQPLVHDCSLIELPIRRYHHLYLVLQLRKILNSGLLSILLDNACHKHRILVLRELVQK